MSKISDRSLFVICISFAVLALVSVVGFGSYQIYKLIKNPPIETLPNGQKLDVEEIGKYLVSQGFVTKHDDSACKSKGSCNLFVKEDLQMAAIIEDNNSFSLITQVNFASQDQAKMAIAILEAVYEKDIPKWAFSHVPDAFKGNVQNGVVLGLKVQVNFDDQGFLVFNIEPNL